MYVYFFLLNACRKYTLHRWRAAEHLCQFIIDNPSTFKDKKICELGAGLGLVAVLLEKLEYTSPSSLVITDGDEPTMELLIDNKVDNECFFETSYLYWGLCEDFQSSYPDKFEIVIAADVIYEDAQVEPLLDTVCAIMQGNYHFAVPLCHHCAFKNVGSL